MSAQAFPDSPVAHNGGYTQVAEDTTPSNVIDLSSAFQRKQQMHEVMRDFSGGYASNPSASKYRAKILEFPSGKPIEK